MSNNEIKVLAVDFDGTIVDNEYPDIGTPRKDVVKFCKRWKEQGNKLILWTSRQGLYLEKAIALCNLLGIHFDAVNDNIPEFIDKYKGNPRKVFADFYLDDRNVTHAKVNTDVRYRWASLLEEIENDEGKNDYK